MNEWLQDFWDAHRRECLIAIIIIALAGGMWYQHQGKRSTNNQAFTTQGSTRTRKVSHSTSSAAIFVDIKGAVNRPGVYRLSRGSRVEEALKSAGGPSPEADMNQVNLAKELQDAQVVYIPKHGEQIPAEFGGSGGASAGNGGAASDASSGPIVNLNTATKDQLQQLTGIGDKKADLIIAYRQAHGSFKSVDDLKNVQGFGDKIVAKLKDQLSV